MNDRQAYRASLGLPNLGLDEGKPHGSLTEAMVDELRSRAEKAEVRVLALEMAIARIRSFEPDICDSLLAKAAELEAEALATAENVRRARAM